MRLKNRLLSFYSVWFFYAVYPLPNSTWSGHLGQRPLAQMFQSYRQIISARKSPPFRGSAVTPNLRECGTARVGTRLRSRLIYMLNIIQWVH
jgi:hypothetical protein